MRATLAALVVVVVALGSVLSCHRDSTVRKVDDDRPPVKKPVDDPPPSFRLVELIDESFQMTVIDREAYVYTADAPRANETQLLWRLDGRGLTKLPYPEASIGAGPSLKIKHVTGHFPDDLVLVTDVIAWPPDSRCVQWNAGGWIDSVTPCFAHFPWGDGRVVRYDKTTQTIRFRDGSAGPSLASSPVCRVAKVLDGVIVRETIAGHTIAAADCDGASHLHHWSRGASEGHPLLEPPWFDTEGVRFAASPSGDLYAFGSSRRFLGKLEGSTLTELAIDPRPAGQIVALAVLSSGRMIAAFGRTDLQIGPPADLWTRSVEGTWSHMERPPGGDGRSFTVQGLVALGDKVWLSVRIEGNSKSPRGNALFVSP